MEVAIIAGIAVIVIAIVIAVNAKNKAAARENYKNVQSIVASFLADYEAIKKAYIAHSDMQRLLHKYQGCYDSVKRIRIDKLDQDSSAQAKSFLDKYASFEKSVPSFNEAFIEAEKRCCTGLFSVDGKKLDDQQQTAVVTDEDHNLVLAGAGSGKTLTITGKVKYLCERKGVAPEEILLIAFARKAAEEMTERVSKMGYVLEAKTFHKLGLGIISEASGSRPDVIEENEFRAFMEDYFANKVLEQPITIKALIEYFAYYLNIPANMDQFDSLGAAYEHERNSDFETLKSKYIHDKAEEYAKEKRTLQGEFVRSLEEILIANFLFLNGVNYEYERKYPFPTGDKYRKAYTPDFYLTDYDIYLEHW